MSREVTFSQIADHTYDDVKKVLQADTYSTYEEDSLKLADLYLAEGSLDIYSSVLTQDTEFRRYWLLPDEELSVLVSNSSNLTRYEATLVACNFEKEVAEQRYKTFVYAEEGLDIGDSFLSAVSSTKDIFFAKGIPEVADLPHSLDIIFLLKGRDEVVTGVYNVVKGDTVNTSRLESYIVKYGDKVKLISMLIDYADAWSSSVMIACSSWEEAAEYVTKPFEESLHHLTYTISGMFVSLTIYHHIELRSWKLIYHPYRVHYDYMDIVLNGSIVLANLTYAGLDKEMYKKKNMLNNMLPIEASEIFRKAKLYTTLTSMFPREHKDFAVPSVTMGTTRSFSNLSERLKSDILIVKPTSVLASGGGGISRVYDQESLDKSIEKLKDWAQDTSGALKGEDVVNSAVVSTYLRQPFTVQGRKVHFRAIVAVTTFGVSKWYRNLACFFAGSKYIDGDYESDLVHDTHAKTTDQFILYPRDFSADDRKLLSEGIEDTMEKVTDMMRGKFWPYEESRFAFGIFGIDLLCDTSGKCYILEVNSKPTMDTPVGAERKQVDKGREYMRELCEWLVSECVRPVIDGFLLKMKLVLIESSNKRQREELRQIASDRETMSEIGKGDVWSRDYITGMYEQSIRDSLMPQDKRLNYNWLVTYEGETIGFISTRPGVSYGSHRDDTEVQLRIFVGKKRQGYGRRALALTKDKLRDKKVYAITSFFNESANKLFETSGTYVKVAENVLAYGKLSNVYARK